MTSRISYNIHAQKVQDRDKLLRHLQKVQPAAVLVMDGLQLARDIKGMLPNAVVISRMYPDEDIQNHISPEDWLRTRGPQAEGGIFQYTSNEAGFSPNLIDWHARLMKLAVKSRTPLVIGNMSVGTPAPEDWAAGRELLELLDRHRDLFILGLHEYACGVITSGFLGGYPDNAGVPPNSGQKGRNLIPSANWPDKMEAATMTMFHCGRFKFLLKYCQSIGLRPPRIILTEHGFDDVSDIKGWSQTLQMTPPYKSIRGWKSCVNQWRAWYLAHGWSPQRAMFEQLAYADRVIYQFMPVEAQLLFCWASPNSDWEQFDLSRADEFQQLLEGYASPGQPPDTQPPIPAYPPLPALDDPRWEAVLTQCNGNVNVRDLPDKAAKIIGQVHTAQRVDIISDAMSGVWMPIKISDTLAGWVSTDVISFVALPAPVPPDPPDTIEIPRAEAEALRDQAQAFADHLTELLNQ